MTDVLEQLLKEVEEAGAEWEYPWDPAGLFRGVAGIAGAYVAQTESALQSERLQRERGADLTVERSLSTQTGTDHAGDRLRRLNGAQTLQDVAWSISDRMTRLHQAAQRRERRSVHSGSSAGPVFGNDAFSVRGGVEQKTHIPDYAARVDAVFARDARRYDGPLRLL